MVSASGEDALSGEPEKEPLFMGRFYLGLRGGAAFNLYTISQPSESGGPSTPWNIYYEAAVLAEFAILRFLGIQAEAVITEDSFRVSRIPAGGTNRITYQFNAISLLFPLVLKASIRIASVEPSIYAGGYFMLPLESIVVQNGNPNIWDSRYLLSAELPLGFLAGLEIAFPLGPGRLLIDARYYRDLGASTLSGMDNFSYFRSKASVSLGYKFLLLSRRPQAPPASGTR